MHPFGYVLVSVCVNLCTQFENYTKKGTMYQNNKDEPKDESEMVSSVLEISKIQPFSNILFDYHIVAVHLLFELL